MWAISSHAYLPSVYLQSRVYSRSLPIFKTGFSYCWLLEFFLCSRYQSFIRYMTCVMNVGLFVCLFGFLACGPLSVPASFVESPSFLHSTAFVPWSYYWVYFVPQSNSISDMCGSSSGLPLLFYWSICVSFQQYY